MKGMRNIIIVEAISTGYNLVEDCVRRGYNPIVLEYDTDNEDVIIYRDRALKLFFRTPEIIKISDDYEETLEKVRSYDPVLVIPGSEDGVIIATRLADDLGLPGNPYSNIEKMTHKDQMHEALRLAGIRYIKGKVVSSPEEATAFCKENGFKTAVVKPIQSAGSQGLFLCDNIDEVENAVATLLTMNDIFNHPIHSVVVQERIFGTEYIVNTATSNKVHKLTSILRYEKVKTPEGGYIYDYAETVNSLEPGHTALIEYAFKVADAIDFRYGVIHGEYMIDDKGPILIEVNCRPMGCTMIDDYLDKIYGQHESDTMLDTYLDPEGFARSIKNEYSPMYKGALKFVMTPKDMDVEDHPIIMIAKQLRSIYKIDVNPEDQPVFYHKTRDLDTAGGVIYLIHEDENVVMSDIRILRKTEDRFFSFLLNEGTSRKWFIDPKTSKPDFEKIIKECDCYGSILIASDEYLQKEGIQSVTPDTLDNAHKGFDNVIIGYQEVLPGIKESACLELIFKTIDLVKPGGRVIIPEETYDYLSYKKAGAELMMRIKGLRITAPHYGLYGYVIGKNDRY